MEELFENIGNVETKKPVKKNEASINANNSSEKKISCTILHKKYEGGPHKNYDVP
jgi:hypothetical protein